MLHGFVVALAQNEPSDAYSGQMMTYCIPAEHSNGTVTKNSVSNNIINGDWVWKMKDPLSKELKRKMRHYHAIT